MLELHCHTTFSDGTLTPTQLLWAAAEAGVKAIAITDHDTLSGWAEATVAGEALGIDVVPGVELSTVWNERSLHILGFYPDQMRLLPPLSERLEGRKRRAQGMIDALAALGYPIHLAERGEGMAPGRPHLASAMVAAGYVSTSQEAFERFLGEGKPAYVQYDKFSALDGIRLLLQSGAVPVWAHPYLFRGGEIGAVLETLVEAGLMGLEVYHPGHSPHQMAKLKAWCDHYGLIMTGGSDYHGPSMASGDRTLPRLNSFRLPLDLLEPLQAAAQSLT